MVRHLFSKRSLIGSALFLILVGEVTVGFGNGLYTLPGFVALALLYFLFFHLIESLLVHYNLNNLGLVLVTFALYSLLITGFLHQELFNYVEHPKDWLITTLIRIQCSLFPLFAFRLLNRIAPRRQEKGVSVKVAATLFVGYIVLLSPTGLFGFGNAAYVLRHAPVLGLVCIVLLVAALALGLRMRARTAPVGSFPRFTMWSILLLAVALVPILPAFLVLLVTMILVGLYYLAQPGFRRASP